MSARGAPRRGTGCSGRSLVLLAAAAGQRRSTGRASSPIELRDGPPLRQPDRHPAARRAAHAGRARHDVRHRHRRHRPVGGLGGAPSRGAVACLHISQQGDQNSVWRRAGRARASACCCRCVLGLWNGFLVAGIGIQPIIATLILMVAGRGLAQLITEGQIITVNSAPVQADRRRATGSTLPFSILIALAVVALAARADPAHRAGHDHRVGRRQRRGQPAGRHPVAPAHPAGLRDLRVLRRHRRLHGVAPTSPAPTATTPACGSSWTRSWPSSSAARRWPAAGSRISGTVLGALIIQTLTTTVYAMNITPQTSLLFKAIVVIAVCLIQSPAVPGAGVGADGDRPPPRRHGARRRRWRCRHDHRSTLTWDRSRGYRPPSRGTSRCWPRWRCCWSCTSIGVVAVPGVLQRPGHLQRLHRQRVPARGRDRHDLRHPHRRHRPVGRLGGGDDRHDLAPRCCSTAGRRALVHRRWRWRSAPLLGFAMGCIIHYFEIQPFIVTLAGMFFARGMCTAISTVSIPITTRSGPSMAQTRIRPRRQLRLARACWSRCVVVLVATYVLAYTRLGRNVYAIGGNQQSALLMGLPVARTKIAVYTISGLLLGHRRDPAVASTRCPGYRLHRASAWSSTRSPRSSSAARCSPAARATCSARCSACWCSA